ncbi:ABC transporter ATP-binding protein/permease [Omnitrophica bacterium]|nr:ABC transporter ATP-binding protein/permease [Candidatus Omnitrophota bacterium]
MNSWRRFNRYLYRHWKLQAVVIVLGLAATPLALLNPYIAKLIIDKAYVNRDLKAFFILAVISGGIFIINGLMNSLKGYLSRLINKNVGFDMSKDFFRHLQNLPMSFFDNRSTGEHIYRIRSDVNAVSGFVCDVIPQIVTLIPRIILILVIVFRLNWRLALFAASLIPITYIRPYLFAKWEKEATQRRIERAQGFVKRLQEVFSHILLVKSMGKEKDEIERHEKGLRKKIGFELKREKISQISSLSGSLLGKIVTGLITLYGGYQVIKGSITLGSLAAIMIYLRQFVGHLSSIGNLYQKITVSSIMRNRLCEILDIKPDIYDAPDAVPRKIEKGRIDFRNIVFGYKKDTPVLRGINLSIPPGAKVALTGTSGNGKTTILSLLLRLYKQDKGSICIDGVDIEKMTLLFLKSQIGIALQKPLLWNDTVADNILYGAQEGCAHQEIYKAARLAEADDFIRGLPDGYNSVVGERGCKISGGQKQRLAIARALIRGPKILILDEAMSSVDSKTEERIIDNILNEFKASTVITVSHRLSTVRKMDLVYFLRDGSTVNRGTHDELLDSDPHYKELFAGQIDDFADNKILRADSFLDI